MSPAFYDGVLVPVVDASGASVAARLLPAWLCLCAMQDVSAVLLWTYDDGNYDKQVRGPSYLKAMATQ